MEKNYLKKRRGPGGRQDLVSEGVRGLGGVKPARWQQEPELQVGLCGSADGARNSGKGCWFSFCERVKGKK